MIRTIKMMLANIRARSLDMESYKGFCWAAGQILRGVSAEKLEPQALGTFNRNKYEDAFDRGVNDAIYAAQRNGWLK